MVTTHALSALMAGHAIVPTFSPRVHSHRTALVSMLMVMAFGLVACSSTPSSKTDADAQPQAITTLEEHLVRARQAEESGEKDKARELYRAAAKAYPVAEEPWQKLAESYFNSGDYGNAILASQEVMQRDPQDPVAASVQAISGLRLSTQALTTLREQAEAQRVKAGGAPGKPLTNASIIVAARLEAETLTRQLREVLGEPVLVPQAVSVTGQRGRPRALPAVRPVTPVAAPAATAAPIVKPVTPVVPARPTPAGNPFDKLK